MVSTIKPNRHLKIGAKRKTRKRRKRKNIVKGLDTIFSIYIRRRNADSKGMVKCVTCGCKKHWKEVHAGHFISRRFYATRWDEDNVQVQCPSCNIARQGEQYVYGCWLNSQCDGLADKLVEQSKKVVKFTDKRLEELTAYYRGLVKEMDKW